MTISTRKKGLFNVKKVNSTDLKHTRLYTYLHTIYKDLFPLYYPWIVCKGTCIQHANVYPNCSFIAALFA